MESRTQPVPEFLVRSYEEVCQELENSKPPPREEPLPDLVVYTQDWTAPPGTPDVVQKRLKELKEDRERIARMWKSEGKTKAYIPNTAEARRMKVQAKLHNRLDLKHTEVVKRQVDITQKAIEIPEDAETIKAIEL